MEIKLNKEIVSQLFGEFDFAFTHSKKSRDEILRELISQNPEIIYSSEDWLHLSQETKNSIIFRIKKSLNTP